jgi:hypothetical protein
MGTPQRGTAESVVGIGEPDLIVDHDDAWLVAEADGNLRVAALLVYVWHDSFLQGLIIANSAHHQVPGCPEIDSP